MYSDQNNVVNTYLDKYKVVIKNSVNTVSEVINFSKSKSQGLNRMKTMSLRATHARFKWPANKLRFLKYPQQSEQCEIGKKNAELGVKCSINLNKLGSLPKCQAVL